MWQHKYVAQNLHLKALSPQISSWALIDTALVHDAVMHTSLYKKTMLNTPVNISAACEVGRPIKVQNSP